MTSAPELLLALGDAGARNEGPSFSIRASIGRAYVARSRRGRACLLIEVTPSSTFPVGRVTGALSLNFTAAVDFEVDGRRWEASCAVIECLDDSFLVAFCAVGLDLANRLEPLRVVAAEHVARALAEWERLFRCRRRLSDNEEMGLWAELVLMTRMPNTDAAVRSWRGPYGEATDFFNSGIGLECKASHRRLQHHVSSTQTERSRGEYSVYVVSMWVDVDHGQGQTLGEIIQLVESQTTEVVALERGLLAAGYSRVDANLYSTKFTLLEEPLWFSDDDVPRVRAVDAGVSNLRYVVQLDESSALCSETVLRLINGFGS